MPNLDQMLAEFVRLRDAAAPGEWTSHRDDYHGTSCVSGGGDSIAHCWYLDEETHSRIPLHEGHDAGNADFIAHAANNIRPLIAAVEAERDALRKVVEAFTERIDRRLMSPLGVIRVHDSQGDAYLHEWASQVLPVIEKALAALAAQREEAK